MKQLLAKSIVLSLLSPLLIGTILGAYYSIVLGHDWGIFIRVLLSALSNAYIPGLAMALFVVPGYLLMYRFNKIQYMGILALGMLGGAAFSYLFSVSAGMVFIVNTCMASLAAGVFLYGLRRFAR